MRRFLSITALPALLILLMAAQGCKSTEKVDAYKYDIIRKDMVALEKEKAGLEGQIENLHAMIAERKVDLAELDALRKESDGLKKLRDDLNLRIKDLQTKLDQRDKTLRDIRKDLEIDTGKKWTVFAGGLKVPIQGDILFSSGKITIKADGKKVLRNLQDSVNKVMKQHNVGIAYIRIDGHTDTDPIKSSGYTDNWVLGAERANAVRKYLFELGGWKAHKVYISSFGYTMPVDKASTKVAKAKNRRVEIYIVPTEKK